MLPLSMNGFGIREATFGYSSPASAFRSNPPILVSFLAALVMLFSLSGAVAYEPWPAFGSA